MRSGKGSMISGLVVAGVLAASAAFGQSGEDVSALKKEIQSIKAGQDEIQKELQEIKKLLAARPAAAAAGPDRALNAMINVAGEPFKGNKNAKLTVVEFSEYQCPFCARHVRDTYPTLDKDYIQTGKIKYVFRDLPLDMHKNAYKAAEAAHCAGEEGKFWEMHDRLFANQKELEPAKLTTYAQAIGVDAKKFQTCLDSGKYTAEVRKDITEANKYGITGTPTTVIGLTTPGDTIKVLRVIRGAQNIAAFKEALDAVASDKPAAAAPSNEKTVAIQPPATN